MLKKKFALWILFVSVLGAGAFVGVIGFAHTKSGRPLLPYLQFVMGKPKGCPLGYDKPMTSAEFRKAGALYLDQHAKLPNVSDKIVPEFTFGLTTSKQLMAYAKEKRGSCHPTSANDLECSEIKTDHGVETLWAKFNSQDKLANIHLIEMIDSVDEAAHKYAGLVDELETHVGQPTKAINSYAAHDLQSGLLYQVEREYFYRNYYSSLRVTNMGKNFAITARFGDPDVYR